MREIRTSGSEGGGAEFNRLSLPLSIKRFLQGDVMRVVVFGAGAMACLFGARLSRVANVTLIDAWTEGIESIRKNGIVCEEASGCSTAHVDAALPGSPLEPGDVAFVLVKAWQTEQVSKYLRNYTRAGSPVISLQNGLGNVERLGPSALPGSTAEGVTLLGPGRVRAGGSGPTHVAAPAWIVDLLKSAGFESYNCDLSEARNLIWGKLAVNCGINALTALLRVPNGELLRRPAAESLMTSAVLECAAVAKELKIDLPFADAAAKVREVAERTAANMSSMLQDVLRGAPTECDAINGAVAREGEKLSVPTPVNWMLWQLVKAAVYRTGASAQNANC
jgi:2-dehydropantoate 2-reductase